MTDLLERDVSELSRAACALDKKVLELESLISQLMRNGFCNGANLDEYREAIGLLTIEKSELEQQLLSKSKEYEDLKKTSMQVAKSLKQSIDSIHTFLESVKGEY